MVSDELIEKHSEDIDSLKKELKALKKSHKQLSDNVAILNLMAFEEQITKLDERINLLDKNLLAVCRALVQFEMEFTKLHMENAISAELSSPTSERVREQITLKFATAKEAIYHSRIHWKFYIISEENVSRFPMN